MAQGKRYKGNQSLVNPEQVYRIDEAFEIIDKMSGAKFDESVDVVFRLGVDARHSDQVVRGVVNLPNGLGKKVRVLAFVKGEKESEAKNAGADFIGGDDMVEKINKGWLDFDRVVATPDMMATASKVARILGPRGLMPNPKLGTVTPDIGRAITEAKAGKVEFRVDKGSNLHVPVGRKSFGKEKLKENFMALLDAVQKARPSGAKGVYLRGVVVSSTMSPGVRIDTDEMIN